MTSSIKERLGDVTSKSIEGESHVIWNGHGSEFDLSPSEMEWV